MNNQAAEALNLSRTIPPLSLLPSLFFATLFEARYKRFFVFLIAYHPDILNISKFLFLFLIRTCCELLKQPQKNLFSEVEVIKEIDII